MISHCSFIPDVVWVREVENGLRHITLRRNIAEETVIRQEGEEKQFNFEETDVYIPDRDSLEKFITQNFGNLFDLGLQQVKETFENNERKQRTETLLEIGDIANDIAVLEASRADVNFALMMGGLL